MNLTVKALSVNILTCVSISNKQLLSYRWGRWDAAAAVTAISQLLISFWQISTAAVNVLCIASQCSHSPPVVQSSHGCRHGWMIMVMQVSGDVAAHMKCGGGVKHTGYEWLLGLCWNNRYRCHIGRLFSPIVSTIGLSDNHTIVLTLVLQC